MLIVVGTFFALAYAALFAFFAARAVREANKSASDFGRPPLIWAVAEMTSLMCLTVAIGGGFSEGLHIPRTNAEFIQAVILLPLGMVAFALACHSSHRLQRISTWIQDTPAAIPKGRMRATCIAHRVYALLSATRVLFIGGIALTIVSLTNLSPAISEGEITLLLLGFPILIVGSYVSWVVILNPEETLRPTPYDLRDRGYDVFISYRSKNANLVRQVADLLLAHNIKAWFAEYCILLTGRERFEASIRAGIQNARWAVIFTNQDWDDSEHCRNELRWLIDRGAQFEGRILQIMIPDEPLAKCDSGCLRSIPASLKKEFDGQHPNPVLSMVDWIKSHATDLNWQPPYQPSMAQVRHVLPIIGEDPIVCSFEDLVLSVELKGWCSLLKLSPKSVLTRGGMLNHMFHLMLDRDGRAVSLQFCCSHADDPKQHQLPFLEDDKELYGVELEFAQRHFARRSAECTGVHLYFDKSNQSQFVTTYWNDGEWIRRYSLVVPHPRAAKRFYDIYFQFGFESMSFAQMCALSGKIQDIVDTLRVSVAASTDPH